MNLLEINSICKSYGTGESTIHALRDVSFSVPKGEFVAVIGESGSGKNTLLNMIEALDFPTAGKVIIDGKDIFTMKNEELTIFRRRNIGPPAARLSQNQSSVFGRNPEHIKLKRKTSSSSAPALRGTAAACRHGKSIDHP